MSTESRVPERTRKGTRVGSDRAAVEPESSESPWIVITPITIKTTHQEGEGAGPR